MAISTKNRHSLSIIALSLMVFLNACGGEDGKPGSAGAIGAAGLNGEDGTGTDGADGADGDAGANGTNGVNGVNGVNGINGTGGANGFNGTNGTNGTNGLPCPTVNGVIQCGVKIADFHGTSYLEKTGEFALAVNPKSYVNTLITSASADVTGQVVINFTVKTLSGAPVTALTVAVSANVVKLVPAAGPAEVSNRWVAYLYGAKTTANTVVAGVNSPSGAGDWNGPPWNVAPTDFVYVASSESSTAPGATPKGTDGTLTNNGGGSYTYTFKKKINAITVDGAAVTYDRTLKHRVSIMMGGHAGPTSTDTFDFVPDGSVNTESRDIVETETCKECHGSEFHGHGGNRLTAENCMTCHNPSVTANVNLDAQSRESMDMKVMIHKIHAGGEVASIPGLDGVLFDDPTTVDDETADNGKYIFWGNRASENDWWKVAFPAKIENCTKCHQGAGAQVNNWKTKPSAAACGSCHDTVNFTTGIGHVAGAQPTDQFCASCHSADTGANAVSVQHDRTNNISAIYDARNIPEFNVAVTLDTPGRGYYIAGESPKVYISLFDKVTGLPVDTSGFLQDTTPEGCLVASCPAADGNFTTGYVFVSGPRGNRNPVLSTRARAQIKSALAGPVDLSAAVSLILKVDQGQNVMTVDAYGGDKVLPGTITVKVADGYKRAGIWPAGATNATLADIAAWLNSDPAFKGRAIAQVQGGKLGIRSRNLGKVFAIQLQASNVATTLFAGDLAVKNIAAYYANNDILRHTDVTKDDPMVSWTTDAIVYQLDPVDDLEAGTYVAMGSINDRGVKVKGVEFVINSLGTGTFQVKTAGLEKPPANNCDSCHQVAGKGLAFHDYAELGQDAVDACGGCHDYQPQSVTGLNYTGAHPISKRVHAVHNGSALTYPNTTVAHADIPPSRNWDITFPQDIRNCETCHETGTSSGSWKTEPARLPCMGCHDNDSDTAHIKAMTYDPSPLDAWSGDEEESCKLCHQ